MEGRRRGRKGGRAQDSIYLKIIPLPWDSRTYRAARVLRV
jgi:hypothetical protein